MFLCDEMANHLEKCTLENPTLKHANKPTSGHDPTTVYTLYSVKARLALPPLARGAGAASHCPHMRPSPVIRPKSDAATTSERAMARSAALPRRSPPRPALGPQEPGQGQGQGQGQG